MKPYDLAGGVGHPWGMAFDGAGNLWFAEAGCDLSPRCPPGQPPGQIGFLPAGSSTSQFFTLPAIPGNQPMFVAVDGVGNVWFTTPGNDRIGRFDPATAVFEQWPVTPGSGPWQVAFSSDGKLWYTEHLASAIGRFDPVTHAFADFATPTANSQPYGIAVAGSRIWFTENARGVGRVGMLNTVAGNKISEFIVRANPPVDLTPHMITLDGDGNVWWTEGFWRNLGKLVPSQAKAGSCGRSRGPCVGVTEYVLPASPCGRTHSSAIISKPGKHEIWFTDSLSGEVGVINSLTAQVEMHKLSDCGVHANDGMAINPDGSVWWSQQFANQIIRFAQEP